MSYKKASTISLVVFLFIGIYGFVTALSFPPPATAIEIGPGYYPKLLSVLMIISSIIGLISNMKKEDKMIEFIDRKYFFFTFVCMIAFAFIWEKLGYFYIICFIIGVILLLFINKSKLTVKKGVKSMLYSFVVTICSYIIFTKLLGISL